MRSPRPRNLLLLLLLLSAAAAATDFPLRAEFSDVPTIDTQDLHAALDQYLVVDARSDFEYETIHIRNAVNIPVANKQFVEQLKAKAGAEQKIAFYCNGLTCAKSYKAARRAAQAGFTAAQAYDAGIFEWAKAYPDETVLLGESPADPAKLLSKEHFQAKTLPFDEFKAEAADPKAVVIDIRDPYQRTLASDRSKVLDLPDMPVKARQIPLGKITNLLKAKKLQDRHLLIYDAVGKQVKWLQYHLEGAGYTDYAFLKGGVYGVLGVVNK